MRVLELFSGIGGFAKGFEQAGFKFTKHYFSEIDKHAIANYKFNFPNAESIGSVTDVRGNEIERPDIITFGFQLLGNEKGLPVNEVLCFIRQCELLTKSNPTFLSLKMSKGYIPLTEEKTLQQYCEQLPTLGFMSANGNCVTLNGYYPKIESGYILLDILQEEVSQEYFLSEKKTQELMKAWSSK